MFCVQIILVWEPQDFKPFVSCFAMNMAILSSQGKPIHCCINQISSIRKWNLTVGGQARGTIWQKVRNRKSSGNNDKSSHQVIFFKFTFGLSEVMFIPINTKMLCWWNFERLLEPCNKTLGQICKWLSWLNMNKYTDSRLNIFLIYNSFVYVPTGW